jgi:hypothetical protein
MRRDGKDETFLLQFQETLDATRDTECISGGTKTMTFVRREEPDRDVTHCSYFAVPRLASGLNAGAGQAAHGASEASPRWNLSAEGV